MFRTIIVALVILILLVFSLLLFVVEKIVGLFSKDAKDRSTLWVVQLCMRFILFLSGARLTVIGRENLPSKDEAVLYVLNHRSMFDALLMYVLVPAPSGFIAKKELEKIPIIGFWLKELHGLFLDRKDIRQGLQVILTSIETVKNGTSIVVCPEGTRSRDEDELQLLPFHEGSFKIATRSGCRIVPVAIHRASHLLEDHFPKIQATPITMIVGKPIDPKELTRADLKFLGRDVREKIITMLQTDEPV